MKNKKYLYEMLKLSGMTEAYLDTSIQNEWNSELETIKSAIQGELTHLLAAIQSMNGWQPTWQQSEVGIDEYPLNLIHQLAKLKKETLDYRVNLDKKIKNEKNNYIGIAFNTLKNILIIFNDLILKKDHFVNSKDMKKEIQDFYLLHMKHLIEYMQQQLDSAFKVSGLNMRAHI